VGGVGERAARSGKVGLSGASTLDFSTRLSLKPAIDVEEPLLILAIVPVLVGEDTGFANLDGFLPVKVSPVFPTTVLPC
jgi:hypothetical protein